MSVSKTQKLDRDHVSFEHQPSPKEIVGEPQYQPQPEFGSEDERSVKVPSKTTSGRHVTGEPGFTIRDRRHKHLRVTKKAGEKVFERGVEK